MPSESDDCEDATADSEPSSDDRTPEERARAAAAAIEAIGADRLTDTLIEAWEEGGLPPFDDGDGGDHRDDEPNRSAEVDETDDEGAR